MISGIDQVTQEAFDSAEANLIGILRSRYPGMDMRRGTAIRDLLVRPAATVYASGVASTALLRSGMSLASITESSNPASADATLAMFGVRRGEGALSQGTVHVVVDARRRYVFEAGFSFRADNERRFETASAIEFDAEDLLPMGDGNFSFLLPVVASEAGDAGNVASGSAMDPESAIFGLVSSAAASEFSGGSDPESPQAAAARVSSALSARSAGTRVSAFASLRDAFGQVVKDMGATGFGDPAQVRGRVNALGLTRPGVVDVYPRTFSSPVVAVLEKRGVWVADGTYRIPVSAADAPGFQRVKSVFDAGTPAAGSYEYSVAYGLESPDSRHWVESAADAANTVWRSAVVTVSGVPGTEPERDFGLELYAPPSVLSIQRWFDDPATRNLGSDVVVRSPFLVLVSVRIPAAGADFDSNELALAVCERINGFGFRGKLSRSDIVGTVLDFADVGLSEAGLEISGSVEAANGDRMTLSGDVLDLAALEAESLMIHKDTTLFVCEPSSVYVV